MELVNNRKLDKNIYLKLGVKGICWVVLIDGKMICFF